MDNKILVRDDGKFGTIEEYLGFIMSIRVSDFLLVPYDGVHDFGTDICSIVLHKFGQYQTELFVAPREWNTTTKPRNNNFTDLKGAKKMEQHRHPNVDSFEVPLCGNIDFFKNGEPVAPREKVFGVSPKGQSLLFGTFTRILPVDWHGASFGPGGGSFMSVQHWLNGVVPSSVGMDWEGQGNGTAN